MYDKMHPDKVLGYDKKDIDSIYNYAKKLVNHSLREVIPPEVISKIFHAREVKGKFGQNLEKYYFGIENNSDSEPDFKEAGLELKSTPIKKLKKSGGYAPKERLVLNIIDYETIGDENWEKSHFLSKNELLLLVMYLYEQDKNFLDFLIKFVTLWKIEGEDKEIIRQDWQKIVKKIREGKAHELSEGDTFYLGACRKGNDEEPREYPYGPPAKQRAFSFKLKFMRSILEKIEDSEAIVKNIKELKVKSFEEIVYDRFSPFIGLNIEKIERRLDLKLNKSAKNYYAALARRMMGVDTNKIKEFEKADVTMKIIRLKHNGVPKEDMSFPKFIFKELAEQEWEESDFLERLESKFFFIVYQMDKDEKEITFKKAFFWNMPMSDIKKAEKAWKLTKRRINEGVKIWEENGITRNNLPNKPENPVVHVRPHGQNKKDVDELPDGRKLTKSCFWLNAKYLKEQIEKN